METESHPILEAARALAPMIREQANAIEAGRRLTPGIVQAMKDAGIFGMTMPRAWGGPELDLIMQVRVIEALAEADGSVGWCAMINSDGGYFGACLDESVAREMYRDLQTPTASSLIFVGRAEKAAGGYRVKGRWPFSSGCTHSGWIFLTCAIYENGEERKLPNGFPERRVCALRAADCEILDTWYTTGLRGSGSNDIAVHDAFVPEERSMPFPFRPRRSEPLYRWPLTFLLNAPGIALGVARGAINSFVELATRKPTTISASMGRPVMLCDEAYAQAALARAEALVGSARSYIYEETAALWRCLLNGEKLSLRQRGTYRLALAHVHEACLEAVQGLYKVVGGSAVYASNPLDRRLRDLTTVNQHTINSPKLQETVGKILFGMDVLDALI
ncbi:MAG TPA: acyl-CoA dehydrogenase family protein [Candidatus Binataceae bacterium]|nr:acyl-CoA dehydrogenase family protein [Candidatus Binataceae bacterium]